MCNLASISLPAFVTTAEDGKPFFDFQRLYEVQTAGLPYRISILSRDVGGRTTLHRGVELGWNAVMLIRCLQVWLRYARVAVLYANILPPFKFTWFHYRGALIRGAVCHVLSAI